MPSPLSSTSNRINAVSLPESSLLGKHFLEALPGLESPAPGRLDVGLDVEGVGTGVSGGAADALSRP